MRQETVGKNYAEALLELATGPGDAERFADLLDAVAAAVQTTPGLAQVLVSPRVSKEAKRKLFADALRDTPRPFQLFVEAVVRRGRALLFPEIAKAYLTLLDHKLDRVRASVTLAREADEATRAVVLDRLRTATGREVIATFHTDPALLGGVVVRVGERVSDGSVRQKMQKLRRALLAG